LCYTEPGLFEGGSAEVDGRQAYRIQKAVSSAYPSPPPAGAFELRGLDPTAAVELGELPQRTSPDQITVYKSVGVAAAALVLRRARERGVGRQLDL
jgi:hypothetical protein